MAQREVAKGLFGVSGLFACLLALPCISQNAKKILKPSSTEGWATLPDWKGARLVPGTTQEAEAEGELVEVSK